MRRGIVVLATTFGLLVALAVAPAAAGAPEWPDEGIYLLCGFDDRPPCIEEFPEDVPFWVLHGVGMEIGQEFNQKGIVPAAGHFDFNLYVDGVQIEEDWTYHYKTVTYKLFIFPEGMTGDHVLTGEWIGACSLADVGVVEGCDLPSDTFPFITNDVPISFVP